MTLGTFWVAKRHHVSSADAVKHELKWGSLVTHGMMPLDSRNFTFFEAPEGMNDTWHVLGGQEAPRVQCRCSQT